MSEAFNDNMERAEGYRQAACDANEQNAELEAELQLYKDLSEHARHDEGCNAAFGDYDCKCGFAEAKEAVDKFEKGKK